MYISFPCLAWAFPLFTLLTCRSSSERGPCHQSWCHGANACLGGDVMAWLRGRVTWHWCDHVTMWCCGAVWPCSLVPFDWWPWDRLCTLFLPRGVTVWPGSPVTVWSFGNVAMWPWDRPVSPKFVCSPSPCCLATFCEERLRGPEKCGICQPSFRV